MKKRLRKKKRLGEFQEYAFLAGMRLADSLDEQAVDEAIDMFIEKAIEDNGLGVFGGGQGHEFEWSVVTMKNRGSVIEEQRKAVEQWLQQYPDVVEFFTSSLIDSWYGNFDGPFEWVKK